MLALQDVLPALFSFSLVYVLVSLVQRSRRATALPTKTTDNGKLDAPPESSWVLPQPESKQQICTTDSPKYRP